MHISIYLIFGLLYLPRFDYLKQCPDINPNPGPGRPQTKLEINFNQPLEHLAEIKSMCQHANVKDNIKLFAEALLKITTEAVNNSTQTTDDEPEEFSVVENLSEAAAHLCSYERSFLLLNIWSQIHDDDQVKVFFLLYEEMTKYQQSRVFALLGNSLNSVVFEASQNKVKFANEFDIDLLKSANKLEFYRSCDNRLQSFIDQITANIKYQNDDVNFKANIYENILKARNNKFVSKAGVKEHLVVYLSSGKSEHASQIFSKQGGKCTRPTLEVILKNSESVCTFKAPDMTTLFFSFDNIQKLLKSHRIGGNHQKKVLAVIVCSILCLLPDGECKNTLQYAVKNSPASWYSNYKFEAGLVIEDISTETLKKCIKVSEEDHDVFNKVFENDLKDAIEYVKNDMNENQEDNIDIKTKAEISKRRKLCESGHINDNVRGNRAICDRQFCKSRLVEREKNKEQVNNKKDITNDVTDRSSEKARLYLNVPNILLDSTPKELAVGALDVNPNTPERIAKVLDKILEASDIKNKYPVKIELSEAGITKVYDENEEFRKFVVVTADGLPYKIMIDLLKNRHTCATCGKKILFLADMTQHMKETNHNEYYQTYGCVLPNIGQFHFALTMLRSLVKLEWNMDYQELCKSIHFETEKALFMQEKVTDFRKSLDTYRTARAAKLRELVTPFVKYALENEVKMDIEKYLNWKNTFVICPLYKTVFQIEKYYGTSFLLYHAALRANNFYLSNIAKKIFSPLFHINRHPNYAVMEIHTDYLDQKMSEHVPNLRKYLNERKSSNFTKQPYASEPHDERHEEFNRRGLRMQNIKTADEFMQSFQLIDHYVKMKESCYHDYGIKIHGGNSITLQDYEENIAKMRVAMRKQKYLTKPEVDNGFYSMGNEELNPKLINIFKIANDQRQEDVLNVIRYNNFDAAHQNSSKLSVLKNEVKDKLEMNFETQLKILITSEEDAEIRENLKEYYKHAKKNPNFDEEKIIEDILTRNFSFL